ncbi:F-box/LRR-repeat protein 4 [Anopheles gambiae]|uniref:F-box/LRR-repeat protein 4 n=1 Tax=Anopheles gambiae TaxID=7165 RepID=UPI002AC92783|nr:F-box/LRR-repeat protein 4 [Anopheles gambiae]XP_061515493.1 F-box/LRR-repeat protein 4 [Anopheles gambiae]XP_310622.4 F-box/LRR-repeat protein 4 [Anopheles gambiae]
MSRERPLLTPVCYVGERKQFVESILMASNEYGPNLSYSSINLIGRPSNFPIYGDHTDSYLLSSYGKWPRLAPSYRPEFGLARIAPCDNPPVDEFFVVSFEQAVYPAEIGVYETLHPGTIRRISCYVLKVGWVCLWDGRSDKWEYVAGDRSASPARLFVPTLRTVPHRTRVLRFELNMRDQRYISGLDGIILVGGVHDFHEARAKVQAVASAAASPTPPPVEATAALELIGKAAGGTNQPNLTDMPYEVLYHILSHLDWFALADVEKVCVRCAEVVADARLYREVNLRPYWDRVDSHFLLWLSNRCTGIKKLDLSGCGIVNEFNIIDLQMFFNRHGRTLTHLRLNCIGVQHAMSFVLLLCPELTELCMQNALLDNQRYQPSVCKRLTVLDLSRAQCASETLLALLQQNPHLQHLSLASCDQSSLSDITHTIGEHNRALLSLKLWKTHALGAHGLVPLQHCTKLQELDLGYSNHEECAEGTLAQLAAACPDLRWLVLGGFRGITNNDLLAIARHCPRLQYLDLMCSVMLSGEAINAIFIGCPALRLLELSYCNGIEQEWINMWRRDFPHVDVKHQH